MAHPSVLEAGVIGVADAHGLTRPHAFVVLKPGWAASDDLATALTELVRSRGGRRTPAAVTFVPDLPKTATGKIQRFRLRGA